MDPVRTVSPASVVFCRVVWLAAVISLALRGPDAVACYAIVVGRGASADGSVLVAHAEQNSGRRLLNFRRIPRQLFADDPVVRLEQSGALPAAKENWAVLWSYAWWGSLRSTHPTS